MLLLCINCQPLLANAACVHVGWNLCLCACGVEPPSVRMRRGIPACAHVGWNPCLCACDVESLSVRMCGRVPACAYLSMGLAIKSTAWQTQLSCLQVLILFANADSCWLFAICYAQDKHAGPVKLSEDLYFFICCYVLPRPSAWAAGYNTRLLFRLMPKGVTISFLFFSLRACGSA